MIWVAPALFCLAFVAACGASTESTDPAEPGRPASELVESDSQDRVTSGESTATPMPEPSSTPAPTATAAATATSRPPPVTTAAPIATPASTGTQIPPPRGLRPDDFVALWGILAPIAADAAPDRPAPVELPVAVPSGYEQLDLWSYPIGDGVLLATSLAGDSIDGYVLLFDSDDPDALLSIVPLGVSIDEATVFGSVIDAIYQGDPFVEPDVPLALDGGQHGVELLRTGADPLNDPLWMLTAVPKNSSVGHDRLRRAAAQAARDTF